MKHHVKTTWKQDMLFDSEANGHHVIMDAPGELNAGIPPKKLMLSALAGCTGMDVLAMLRKMRVEITGFRLHIEAELTDDLPRHYHRMHVVYAFSGQELPVDKLERAVQLSKEKYCGVSYMYKKAGVRLTHEIRVSPA